ncbi:MAG TPA: sugar ABC transporter permease [Streptosporangiaceae bacterium]|jgi:ABC-type sugar transport system permease subunit|nr:sugar ABC transporter permease [Streptosporangiaceae bacterium]
MVDTVGDRQATTAAGSGRAFRGRARPPAASRWQSVTTFIRRHKLAPYLLLVPSLAAIGLVLIWPTLQVGLYSFQNFGEAQIVGTQPATWAGFSNFTTTLRDPEFWLSLRTTVVFAATLVTLTMITGTLVGLLLNRLGRRMAAFVSGAALVAWATPAVSASVIFVWFFSPDGGIVNWALARLPHWLGGGAHWAQYNWATTGPVPAYTIATILVVWQSFPFIAVTVLAGLKSIPSELYESARVDGAGPWQSFRKITYPMLKPIFLVLVLLSVIWDFNVFTQSYVITGALGNRDEYNMALYSYSQAFLQPPQVGLGSAIALILTAILMIITIGYVRANIKQGALA